MKIALLGSTGMLGSKALSLFRERNHEVLAPGREEVDLSHPYLIEEFFKAQPFDVLVNCAAFTRVDACEEPARFSQVLGVNGTALGWLARFCRKTGRVLVHFSTDYIFDGRKEEPYREEDEPAPLNVYGRTKLQGERLVLAEDPSHYLVRTSWVFGPKGEHFVKKMASLLGTRSRIEVVSDQVGGPTYTGDLVRFVLALLERKAPWGTYHFANSGHASWYGFTKEIQAQLRLPGCEVVSVPSTKVFRPAERPANSRFDLSKAQAFLGAPIRPWQEALKDYLTQEFPLEAS